MNDREGRQDQEDLLKRMKAKAREHFQALDNGTSKPIPPDARYNDGHAVGMNDYDQLRNDQQRRPRRDEGGTVASN